MVRNFSDINFFKSYIKNKDFIESGNGEVSKDLFKGTEYAGSYIINKQAANNRNANTITLDLLKKFVPDGELHLFD